MLFMFFVFIIGSFRWVSNNEEPSYYNWHGNQPDDAGRKEDCVHHYESGWNDLECKSSRAHALCQYSRGKEKN